MHLSKEGSIFLTIIILISLIVSTISLTSTTTDPLWLSIRLFALNGFISISIAIILTPFLKGVKNAFGTSFKGVHHSFAAIGLILITLHPIGILISTMDITIFVPNLQSFGLFWYYAGRQALIIIYIALAATVARRNIPKYWRLIHAFMYVALFFGVIHGNLLGTDFQNTIVNIIMNALFASTVAAFLLKRYQQIRMKKMVNRIKNKRHTEKEKQS